MVDFIKAPTSVDELVFHNAATEKRVRQYANVKRKGNILLHGPKGTGKSTTAKVIAAETGKNGTFQYPVRVYNGATFDDQILRQIERDWDFLRNADAAYVVIDEVDRLSATQQARLRAFLDQARGGNVIMTTNNLHNIDAPLADRCDVIEFPAIDAAQWRTRMEQWLREQGVIAAEEQIRGVIDTNNGSIRDLIQGVEDMILEYT